MDSPILQSDPCEWAAFLKEIISRVIMTERYLWFVFRVSSPSARVVSRVDLHNISASSTNMWFSLISNKRDGL